MAVSLRREARGPLVAVVVASLAVVVGEGFHVAHEHLERLLLQVAVHGGHCHACLFGAAHPAVDKILKLTDKSLVPLGDVHKVDVAAYPNVWIRCGIDFNKSEKSIIVRKLTHD